MGHYDDCYEADRVYREGLIKKERARLKREFPNDPSQWGLSLEERVELLEKLVNRPKKRRKGRAAD